MASIKKIEGKKGVSYKITVTCGLDLQGKKIRHFKTWTPPAGMGARKAEKEVKKVAARPSRNMHGTLSGSKKARGPGYRQ